jgi:S-adenosylmethionine hydrolase
VFAIDRFGNVQLDATRDDLAEAGIKPGSRIAVETRHGRHEATYGRTFADVPQGGLLVYEDSYQAIAVAINKGSAAALLGLDTDAPLRIVRQTDG